MFSLLFDREASGSRDSCADESSDGLASDIDESRDEGRVDSNGCCRVIV